MITTEEIKTITQTLEAVNIRLNQFSEIGANCHVDFLKTYKDSVTNETLKTENISVHLGSDLIGSLPAFPDAYSQLKDLAYVELEKILAKRAADLLAAKAEELAAAQAIVDAAP
jgi:hypothetical protein